LETKNLNIAGEWGGGAGKHQEQDKDQSKTFSTNPKFRKWLIQDGESYSDVFHSRADKFPKDNQRIICMKFFLLGKCITKCPRLHQLSDKAVIAVNKFVRDCRAEPAPPAQLKNKYVRDKERDEQDFGLGAEKKQKT